MASDASSLGHAPPPADASSSTIHGVIESDARPRPPSNIEPPTVTPVDQINPDARSILEDSISTMFGIDTPRDLQLEVINHCAWDDNAVVFVNAKTAVGKSLCPLTAAAMRRKVSIFLVPLIGLGSDQVSKASRPDHNIEAYHIDEHHGIDAKALRD